MRLTIYLEKCNGSLHTSCRPPLRWRSLLCLLPAQRHPAPTRMRYYSTGIIHEEPTCDGGAGGSAARVELCGGMTACVAKQYVCKTHASHWKCAECPHTCLKDQVRVSSQWFHPQAQHLPAQFRVVVLMDNITHCTRHGESSIFQNKSILKGICAQGKNNVTAAVHSYYDEACRDWVLYCFLSGQLTQFYTHLEHHSCYGGACFHRFGCLSCKKTLQRSISRERETKRKY